MSLGHEPIKISRSKGSYHYSVQHCLLDISRKKAVSYNRVRWMGVVQQSTPVLMHFVLCTSQKARALFLLAHWSSQYTAATRKSFYEIKWLIVVNLIQVLLGSTWLCLGFRCRLTGSVDPLQCRQRWNRFDRECALYGLYRPRSCWTLLSTVSTSVSWHLLWTWIWNVLCSCSVIGLLGHLPLQETHGKVVREANCVELSNLDSIELCS